MPISNVIIADDITLISPRVKGLQKMIIAMEKYSNKWRFLFDISKTAIVTFGESSVVNSCNQKKRTWYLYNQPIVEKKAVNMQAYIILSSDFSSRERTTNVARKEVVSSLMSVGVRPGGLNPICSKDALWFSALVEHYENGHGSVGEGQSFRGKESPRSLPNDKIGSSYWKSGIMDYGRIYP